MLGDFRIQASTNSTPPSQHKTRTHFGHQSKRLRGGEGGKTSDEKWAGLELWIGYRVGQHRLYGIVKIAEMDCIVVLNINMKRIWVLDVVVCLFMVSGTMPRQSFFHDFSR